MDALLAIASRREVREYLDEPVPDAIVHRILEAGRAAGSGRNRQPSRFIVVRSRELLDELAETVSRATNLQGAPLLVVVVVQGEGPLAFDGGRSAQNLMLAAWSEGIGSCPNGFIDKARAAELLALTPDQELLMGISLGYPLHPPPPADSRSPAEWISGLDRLPLDEVVQAWL